MRNILSNQAALGIVNAIYKDAVMEIEDVTTNDPNGRQFAEAIAYEVCVKLYDRYATKPAHGTWEPS